MNFRNRIAVSPIRQYSAADGFAGDWHFARLNARAGLILTEAAAVEARGRISPELGIWRDSHVEPPARTNRFTSAHGAVPEADGGWGVVGPTAEAFSKTYPAPQALSEESFRRSRTPPSAPSPPVSELSSFTPRTATC